MPYWLKRKLVQYRYYPFLDLVVFSVLTFIIGYLVGITSAYSDMITIINEWGGVGAEVGASGAPPAPTS